MYLRHFWLGDGRHLSHLLEFLYHLLDAELRAVRHLVFHLCQPFTQLPILLIENDPGIQPVSNLLLTKRHLQRERDNTLEKR